MYSLNFPTCFCLDPNSPFHHRTPHPLKPPASTLPVTLRHPLQLVLFLDRIAVAAPLGRVDELLRQALRHRLDVPERRLARPDRQQRDGLVDAPQRRHVDRLPPHRARGPDPRAVFPGPAVDDGVDGDLDRVLVRHDVDL